MWEKRLKFLLIWSLPQNTFHPNSTGYPGYTQRSPRRLHLLEDGVIQRAHFPFNSPIWYIKILDSSQRMRASYLLLNKTAPHSELQCPTLPLPSSKLYLKLWHAAWDPEKAVFGIPAANEPQEQSACSCLGQQYTFTVLPQGYPHSRTICHELGVQFQHFSTF